MIGTNIIALFKVPSVNLLNFYSIKIYGKFAEV